MIIIFTQKTFISTLSQAVILFFCLPEYDALFKPFSWLALSHQDFSLLPPPSCSWPSFCAGSLRTWCRLCEAAAEETSASHGGRKGRSQDWEPRSVNLKVAGQDGSVVQFKIKRHTPLSKLMKAYCERQVRSWHVYFLWIKRTLKNTNIFLRNRNQHNVTIDCFW